MFKVGDKLVYPMHGIGILEKIEEKEVLGKKKLYYFVRLDYGGMVLMIPVEQSQNLKLRKILFENSLNTVFSILEEPSDDLSLNWKVRYNNNQKKLKEGSLKSLSEIVRDLFHRNRVKELSRGEKSLYDQSIRFLTDELAYTEKRDDQELKEEILNHLNQFKSSEKE